MGKEFDNTKHEVAREKPDGFINDGFDIHGNKVVSSTDADGQVSYIVYKRIQPKYDIIADASKVVEDQENRREFVDNMNA